MTVQPISTSASYTADRSWLGSLHGIDSTETITLDITKFTAGTHYQASTDPIQPYSRVLSGVPVARRAVQPGRDRRRSESRQPGVRRRRVLARSDQGRGRDAVAGGIDPTKVTPSTTDPLIRFI